MASEKPDVRRTGKRRSQLEQLGLWKKRGGNGVGPVAHRRVREPARRTIAGVLKIVETRWNSIEMQYVWLDIPHFLASLVDSYTAFTSDHGIVQPPPNHTASGVARNRGDSANTWRTDSAAISAPTTPTRMMVVRGCSPISGASSPARPQPCCLPRRWNVYRNGRSRGPALKLDPHRASHASRVAPRRTHSDRRAAAAASSCSAASLTAGEASPCDRRIQPG